MPNQKYDAKKANDKAQASKNKAQASKNNNKKPPRRSTKAK
jgi:hypothetical protein